MTGTAQATAHSLLLRAADRARLAPSVHNTQPWLFSVGPDRLELYCDPSRQLRIIDPDSRQLTISCGCAVFNARVSLAAAGYASQVERFPDPQEPTLAARIRLAGSLSEWDPIGVLDASIERRRSNRREYFSDDVPAELRYDLARAALTEGSQLVELARREDRNLVGLLTKEADARQQLSPAYRAEIRAWTSDDPRRPDGVQAMSVPHVDGEAVDDLPLRDFDTHGMGWLPTRTRSSADQCLLLLNTTEDRQQDWLRAGEALQRVWLEATRAGFAISLFTQPVEVGEIRDRMRTLLALSGHPQLLLRLGHAPATPAARRRPLEDMLLS